MVVMEASSLRELMSVILGEERPVVVDFYTEWCAPCRLMSELVLRRLEDRYGDGVVIVRVDCERAMDAAARFSVMSVPTVLVFHRRKLVEHLVGFSSSIAERILSLVGGLIRDG